VVVPVREHTFNSVFQALQIKLDNLIFYLSDGKHIRR
jgi:hypothetical protein